MPSDRIRQQTLGPQLSQRRPDHDPGRHHGHRHPGGLGHEGDGPAGSGVGLEHVGLVFFDGELHIAQADDGERFADHPHMALQLSDDRWGKRLGRQGARRVARVHSRFFHVLHDAADDHLAGGVAHCVNVDFDGVLQEPVN